MLAVFAEVINHAIHTPEDNASLGQGVRDILKNDGGAEALRERYEQVSGLPVDPERLRWYRVLNCFQVITTTMATMYRVAKLGKSHQDILLARLKAIAPVGAHELCELLEGSV